MPTLQAPILRLGAQTATSVSLAWTDPNPNDKGTEIQRSRDGGLYATVATPAKGVQTWTDPLVPIATTAGIALRYRIRARAASGSVSPWSNTVATIITPAEAVRTIHFGWNANPEPLVTGYRLYAGRTSGNYTAPSKDMGLVTNGYYAVNLLTGQGTWFFALTAYTASQESGFSTEVSTTI